MNRTVTIAAASSLLIFGGIIAVFLLLHRGDESTQTGGESAGTAAQVASTPRDPASETTSRGQPFDPSVGLERGSVEVHLEVRDKARGQLLAHARYRVFRKSDAASRSEVTGLPPMSRGTVLLPLQPGTYEILAECSRYTPASHTVTLATGQERQEVVALLEPGTSISGIVLDARTRQPVSGARVQAFEELGDPDGDLEDLLRRFPEIDKLAQEVASEYTTGSDGRFELYGLKNFWYTVRADAATYSPGSRNGIRAPREGVEIVLPEGSVLAGVVQDPSGRPLADAWIRAFQEPRDAGLFEIILAKSRPAIEEFRTAGDGRFRLERLGTGLYNFAVQAPGFQEHLEEKLSVRAGPNAEKVFTLQPGSVIHGYVRGPQDEPIAGARVRPTPQGVTGQQRRDKIYIDFKSSDQVTDETGYFKFDTLNDGAYMLLVFHDAYESLQKRDVRPSQEPVHLRLGYGGRLTGVVSDAATGQPIAGATVSASDLANLPREDVTDESGRYALGGLGATRRPVTVHVMAEEYARAKKQVTVVAGQEFEENFELVQTGIVEGRIVSTGGDPLPGAHVEVRPTEDSSPTLRVLGTGTSGSDGRFTIDNVEPGEALVVRVKLPPYLEIYSGVFALTAGERVEVGDVAMAIGGELKGMVVNSAGEPVGGAWLEVRPEGSTDIDRRRGTENAQTDRSGVFHVRGLQGGHYDLIVKAPGYRDQEERSLEVREGEVHQNIRIVLEAGSLFAGSIVDTARAPVQGAEILVRDFGEGIQERRAVSDGQGRFEFTNLISEDTVEIEVRHPDYADFQDRQVRVGTSDYQVVLEPLAALIGRVLDPQGNPVDSFSVQPQPVEGQRSSGGKLLRAKTFNTADGRFEYKGLPEGTYTVSVRSLRYSAVVLDSVQVGPGNLLDLGDIQLSEGGVISGTVIASGTGAPVAGARVRIVEGRAALEPGQTSSAVTTTDAAGAFSFSGIKDQAVSLDVSHEQYAEERIGGVDPRVASTSQGLVIELQPAAQVFGTVVDSRRKPIQKIHVYLTSGKGDGVSRPAGARDQRVETDERGNFLFARVSPGLYRVTAHQFNPPRRAEQQVEVLAGDRLQLELQIAGE